MVLFGSFLVCASGKFKHITGDERCQPCPNHSKAPDYGLTECRCNAQYYRAEKDPKTMPCTRKCSYKFVCNDIYYWYKLFR